MSRQKDSNRSTKWVNYDQFQYHVHNIASLQSPHRALGLAVSHQPDYLCAMSKTCLQAMLFLFAWAPVAIGAQNPLDEMAAALEKSQLKRLAAQQSRNGVHIAPFKSDGCSGGMSRSWQVLAQTLPPFAAHIGETPPWEHCCVAHDRDYWRGETEDGYEKREYSDAQLRSCVRMTGEQHGTEISASIKLTRKQIVDIINLTSELMYHAVRVGGGPCTGLPWRWGHGWPECSAPLEPGNQI